MPISKRNDTIAVQIAVIAHRAAVDDHSDRDKPLTVQQSVRHYKLHHHHASISLIANYSALCSIITVAASKLSNVSHSLCYHRSRETCMHEYGIFTIKVFIKLKCEIYGKPLIDVRSPEMWVSVRLKLERNETVSLTTFLHISVKSLLMGMI